MQGASWTLVIEKIVVFILLFTILYIVRIAWRSVRYKTRYQVRSQIRKLLDIIGVTFVIRIINKVIGVLFAILAITGYFVARKTRLLGLIQKLNLGKYTWFRIKDGSTFVDFKDIKPHIAFFYDEEDGITLEEVEISYLGVGGGVYMPKMLRRKVWRYIESCATCGKRHL